MSLRRHLLIGYGTVLAIVLIGFSIIVAGVIALGGTPKRIVDKYYASILAAERMSQAVQSQQNAILRTLLSTDYNVTDDLNHADKEFNAWLARAGSSPALLPDEAETLATIKRRYALLQTLVANRARWASIYPWENNVVDAFQNVIQACENLAEMNFNAMVKVSRSAHEHVQLTVGAAAAVVAVILLIGVWASLSLARRLSEPLEQMVEGARRITSGDYQVAIRETTIKEVTQLSRQFNAMAAALQRFRAMDLERVLNEQRQSEAVLQSIDDGLVIFGRDGRIQRLNPVAVRQLDLVPETCIGHSLSELLEDPAIDAAIRRCLEQDDSIDNAAYELQVGETDQLRYLAYSILPISDEHVSRQGAVMVIRDITQHKAFEQMRTEFVMQASHELRTPVTSIRMGIGMLTEKMPFADGSREQELLATVNEELNRLMHLVNDLLDLSRLQAGRQALELAPYEVRELLESARQRFELAATEHNLQLALAVEEEAGFVRVDRVQFDRVLDNLISNALRYTPAGGRIDLRARCNRYRTTVEIADTGCGIDYAHQARVFEPFVQVPGRGGGGGAGLGLAICKELVQQHGGRLLLRSVPGRGATFFIELRRDWSK